MADPEIPLFPGTYEFNKSSVDLSPLILSASGWRKVFAGDGDEESCTSSISLDDRERVVLMADVLGRMFLASCSGSSPGIVIGIDSRYTGPLIADILIRSFLSLGFSVRYLFITPAPEIMAYTRTADDVDGFVYVSASHNPVGHNGLKVGLSSGGVLGGKAADELISSLRAAAADPGPLAERIRAVKEVDPKDLAGVYHASAGWKKQAAQAYADFTRKVISGQKDAEQQKITLSALKNALERYPVSVVAELNGSARTVSIDQNLLQEFGVKVLAVNSIPRQIVHRIVPEGASLNQCAEALSQAHRQDSTFIFGYVPDNDGDRGNIVYIDRTGSPRILEAQTVFALSCLAELCWLEYSGVVHYDQNGKASEKIAVAVNGPTSLRIERILEAFDGKVFRAEVGEANVVDLAHHLRKRGYIVRILGEGSNGGNITYPSSVRDPIDTIFSFLKLLSIRSDDQKMGLYHLWCKRSGQESRYSPDFLLDDIIDSLPRFVTTSAFEDRAKLKINTIDRKALKEKYEVVFSREWDRKKRELERRFGIHFYEEILYEGTVEKHGRGKVSIARNGRGGFKILFKDHDGRPVAFIWMRGSGTEPVFRILADVQGSDRDDEEFLLSWHTAMIKEADELP